jgi:type IV pilus biogenesis protein CpaD/CtpE
MIMIASVPAHYQIMAAPSQVNLAAMIDNPADLVSADVAPRPSGHTTTYGEVRIRRDEVRQLEDAEASFSTSN